MADFYSVLCLQQREEERFDWKTNCLDKFYYVKPVNTLISFLMMLTYRRQRCVLL